MFVVKYKHSIHRIFNRGEWFNEIFLFVIQSGFGAGCTPFFSVGGQFSPAAGTIRTGTAERGIARVTVTIPEQNIAGGTLRLHVQVGRIHHVRYSEGSAHLPWRTSFPIWESDILNVHLLEQGIEQMKRLSSQDVHMELVPAAVPGESDIVLTIQRTSPVHGILSIDDSGLSETGRWQLSAGLGIDNPFYANDYLQVDLNGDGMADGYKRDTRGEQFYYRIPYGKETFSISYSHYKYHQTISNTPYDFISSGNFSYGG